MRKFNAWLVFFKREWNWNWPFLVGFAITGFSSPSSLSVSLGTPLHFSFSFCEYESLSVS
ncbi:hypothetical protein RchiOBHm_Chr7g0198591 [Rosa chinensis]|uniref:Uncharacterized protein n=1 Tax=Rosa chinensis TaxID=74649 RepID=A0A2P6P761_ROSCH|nr:hypothetical protein RchiOBHm_Chr7g0198591 [Rosa chinensis]